MFMPGFITFGCVPITLTLSNFIEPSRSSVVAQHSSLVNTTTSTSLSDFGHGPVTPSKSDFTLLVGGGREGSYVHIHNASIVDMI